MTITASAPAAQPDAHVSVTEILVRVGDTTIRCIAQLAPWPAAGWVWQVEMPHGAVDGGQLRGGDGPRSYSTVDEATSAAAHLAAELDAVAAARRELDDRVAAAWSTYSWVAREPRLARGPRSA